MTGNPLARDFAIKLIKLHRLAELVEETLIERATTLDSELTGASAGLPEHERVDLFEHYSDDFFELSDHFPTTLRYAILVAADTACEVFMTATCKAYQDANPGALRLSDLNGAGIKRARAYLEKVACVTIPNDNSNWMTVWHLHQLRNSIIHADGTVRPDQKDLYKWSASMPGLRISTAGTITLDRQFSKAAIDAYDDYCAEMDLCTGNMALWVEFPVET